MTDERFMGLALAEAGRGLERGEVPIGAVVVHGDEVVARAHWHGLAEGRLLDHPELVTLMEAERTGSVVRRREREETTLYTTLEPCTLCMGAAMSFLLGRIVFALEAPSDGATSLPEAWQPANGHPPPGEPPYSIPAVVGGVGREDSLALIREFVERNPGQPYARTLIP